MRMMIMMASALQPLLAQLIVTLPPGQPRQIQIAMMPMQASILQQLKFVMLEILTMIVTAYPMTLIRS